MPTVVYTYSKCSTCQKAVQWLQERGIEFEERPIRETPPTLEELRWMRGELESIRKLFNRSGMEYRSLGLSQKLGDLQEGEAFRLLRGNGMLVKRPFLVTPRGGAVGFREKRWSALFE